MTARGGGVATLALLLGLPCLATAGTLPHVDQLAPACAGAGSRVTIAGAALGGTRVTVGGKRARVVRHGRTRSFVVPRGLPAGPTTAVVHMGRGHAAQMPFQIPGPEVCDGVDNDCNGLVDDDIVDVSGRHCIGGVMVGDGQRGGTQPRDLCLPGAMESCYDGPLETRHVGICHDGVRTCDEQGAFGPCQGQLLPQPEDPGNGIDENCDGRDGPGGGELCVPGTMQGCYDGPPRTRDVGLCHGGMRTCGAMGLFGMCEGEVLPQPEIPGNHVDENCDGVDVITGPVLRLAVDPPFSPTFQASQVLTGTVSSDRIEPPPPPPTPLFDPPDPPTGHQGESLEVRLSGQDTGFQSGVTQVTFGPGITVTGISADSPTAARIAISIARDAAIGPRLIAVASGHGDTIVPAAFNVLPGVGTVTGRLVDADGHGVGGAQICIGGTALCTTSTGDGTFSLPDAPTTGTRLLVTATGFDPLSVPIAIALGGTAPLGDVPLAFPEEPPPPPPPNGPPITAALASVLGRGVGRLGDGGNPTVLRKLVQDAIIVTGGDEAGVLDANGNQLNPNVAGEGIISLRSAGVDDLGQALATGESRTLGDLLGAWFQFFDYGTSSQPPPLLDVLGGIQDAVNAAWADPTRADAPLWMALFNQGRAISADPPTVSAHALLNPLQQYLLVSSLLAFTSNAVSPPPPPGPHAVVARALHPRDATPPPPDTHEAYTKAWDFVLEHGQAPQYKFDLRTGAIKAEGGNLIYNVVYYSALNNPEVATNAGNRYFNFLTNEPVTRVNAPRVQQLFNSQHFQEGFELARMEAERAAKLSEFAHVGANFVKEALSAVAGAVLETVLKLEVDLVIESLRPEAPEVESIDQLVDAEGKPTRVVAITFKRSRNDTSSNATNLRYTYELFREQRGIAARVACCKVSPTDDPGPDNIRQGANFDELVSLDVPEEGHVLYRARVTRLIGQATVPVDDMKLNPLLAFLTKGAVVAVETGANTVIRTEALNIALTPAAEILRGIKFQRSEIGEPKAAFINTNVSPPQPPANIAVDPTGGGAFVSIPFLGRVFRAQLDGQGGLLTAFTDAGFKQPGQAGLAVDGAGNLYTDNAASDPTFGGRLFKFNQPDGAREFIGSVQYFSFLLGYARPVAVEALAIGPSAGGEALYVADAQSATIKRLFPLRLIHTPPPTLMNGQVAGNAIQPDRNVAQPFADSNLFQFGPLTAMAFAPNGALFVNQGPNILRVARGGTPVAPLFDPLGPPSGFVQTSGVAIDASGTLYVSDLANGTITQIPASAIRTGHTFENLSPVERKKRLVASDLHRPTGVQVSRDQRGLVFFDNAVPFRALAFGLTGQVLDGGNPVVGATIVAKRQSAGDVTATTDADGVFVMPGLLEAGESPIVDFTVTASGRAQSYRVTVNPTGHTIIDAVDFSPPPPRDPTVDAVASTPQPPGMTVNVSTTGKGKTVTPHAGPIRPRPPRVPVQLPKIRPMRWRPRPPPFRLICPRGRILTPASGLATTDPTVTVQGFLTTGQQVETVITMGQLYVNTVPQPIMFDDGSFETDVTLAPGDNVLAVAIPKDQAVMRGCIDTADAIEDDFVILPIAISVFHDPSQEVVDQVSARRGFDLSLTGTLVDSETRDFLVGASLHVPGTSFMTHTDSDGVYQLNLRTKALPGPDVSIKSGEDPTLSINLHIGP